MGGKTPLQCANIPTINSLAKQGELGLVKTVPNDIPPGSDAANLSVMGYDPHKYYTGRSPLEAASMGIDLSATDVTFRCNLVTLSEDEPYAEKTILDHSADEISTDEAAQLISDIHHHFETEAIKFFPGISYRHLMIWHNGPEDFDLMPPHDILDQKITHYLPKGPHKDIIYAMMKKSYSILDKHPINIKRKKRGLRPANSIWIWGEGKKPCLADFYNKYHKKGSVISAVDLIKGIGLCAGLKSIDVEGATGNIHTNFEGKALSAIEELKNGQDFVYVHIEAPDECGHRYEIKNKVKAIEFIDQKIVKVIKQALDELGEDYKIMILPDHPTPLKLRTHTSDPVPYLIYSSNRNTGQQNQSYDESSAQQTGLYFEEGYRLMDYFLDKE